jgi:hypothetical protein
MPGIAARRIMAATNTPRGMYRMKIRFALPIAAAALALSACSGGGSADNVTLSNDSAGVEENVGEDLALNDSGLVEANDTLANVEEGANAADEATANGTTNAL